MLNALRALLGWDHISDRRLTPAHGWLLPAVALREPLPVAVTPAPLAPGSRQRA